MTTVNASSASLERIGLTADIVSAYVANNHVQATEVADLIANVHQTLVKLDRAPLAAPAVAPPLQPAVSVRKSITPDYLICLEDGKQFKSLKRHLSTKYDLTPEAYREKWGLPADYPMVAPAYAEARSALAKSMGLGRRKEERPSKTGRKKKAA